MFYKKLSIWPGKGVRFVDKEFFAKKNLSFHEKKCSQRIFSFCESKVLIVPKL